jgi:hypothetical protein
MIGLVRPMEIGSARVSVMDQGFDFQQSLGAPCLAIAMGI